MKISASEFDKELATMRSLYPKGVAYVTQNLFGSHDSNRISSHIVNRGIENFRDWGTYFNRSIPANNPDYDVRKPNKSEVRLQKLFAILQMTYVGAPMVYYGDEVGMWGGNDPDNRKPMVWKDIKYAKEVYKADGTKRKADKVSINKSLLGHYKQLIAIRNQHEALQVGDYSTLIVDDKLDIYGFERSLGDDKVWVVFNNSNKKQIIKLSNADKRRFKDVLAKLKVKQQGDHLQVTIPQKWGAVLVAQ